MDVLAIHPYGDRTRARRRPTRRTRVPRDRARRLRQARRATRRGVRRHGAAGGRRCRSSTTSTAWRAASRPRRRASTPAPSRPTTRPVDEATQGVLLPPGARARVLPAERARDRSSSTSPTSRPRGLAVGRLLRGRLAEAKPGRGRGRCARDARGVVADCPGLKLVPAVRKVVWPRGTALNGKVPLRFRIQCTLDCSYSARLVPAAGGRTALTLRGQVVGGVLSYVRLPLRPVKPGSYVLRVSLVASVNPGPDPHDREPGPAPAARNRLVYHSSAEPASIGRRGSPGTNPVTSSRLKRLLLLTTLLAALAAPSAASAGPGLLVGAADDEAKSVDLVYAKTHLDLARLAGLDVVRLTAIWTPGRTAPASRELWALRNASIAAGPERHPHRPLRLPVRQSDDAAHRDADSRSSRPTRRRSRAPFPTCDYFIIGNEPNLNRFWMPQFTRARQARVARARTSRCSRSRTTSSRASRREIGVIGGSSRRAARTTRR